jgi:hypothetical protein
VVRCIVWVEFHQIPDMSQLHPFMRDEVPVQVMRTKAFLWTSTEAEPQALLVADKADTFRDMGFRFKEKESMFLLNYRLTRRVTDEEAQNAGITLVEDECDVPTALVKVKRPERPEVKGDFGVCLKDVFTTLTDSSKYFVQWLEMQRLLGATKVMVFVTEPPHPNVDRVLK